MNEKRKRKAAGNTRYQDEEGGEIIMSRRQDETQCPCPEGVGRWSTTLRRLTKPEIDWLAGIWCSHHVDKSAAAGDMVGIRCGDEGGRRSAVGQEKPCLINMIKRMIKV